MKKGSKLSLSLLGFLLICNFSYSFASDTLRLYYGIDKKDLLGINKNKVDSLIRTFGRQPVAIRITGYTDFLAGDEYNLLLSKNRAQIVKEYLLNSGNKRIRVLSWEGKGKVKSVGPNVAEGDPLNRRVDIQIDKPMIGKREGQHKDTFNLKIGSNITLEGLEFIGGQHLIKPESQYILKNLLNSLQTHKKLKIEIQGHVCCMQGQGGDGPDLGTGDNHLSVNRAKYIYDYLKQNGIDSTRMQYIGLGSSQPKVFPELTPEDQQKNRRVEIKILDN